MLAYLRGTLFKRFFGTLKKESVMKLIKNVLSIKDMDNETIDSVISGAYDFDWSEIQPIDSTKKATLLFGERSTRTHGSYCEALRYLGWTTYSISTQQSSIEKGETLANTARMLEIQGTNVLVIRTKIEGGPRFLAELLEDECKHVAVHNAGDGSNQHPTQTLLDLFTIQEKLGRLSDLRIGLCGDLRYGRTVHSLLDALARRRNISLSLIAPKELSIQASYKAPFKNVTEGEELDLLRECDVIYCTRMQKERFPQEIAMDI